MPSVTALCLISHRRLLRGRALAVAVAPYSIFRPRAAFGAAGPLLNAAEPAPKAVQYVEDASRAKRATSDSTCANCALYLGPAGSTQGPCQIFPGKQVKAAGWCSSWAPQM
jgi:High potential iron-sulfur protein